jgi:hypothetical protein
MSVGSLANDQKDAFISVLKHARIFSSCSSGGLQVVNNRLHAIYAKLRTR